MAKITPLAAATTCKIVAAADQERAWRFVRDAQIDLRRQLSNGERRDLLKDNTNWSSDYIAALVEGLIR